MKIALVAISTLFILNYSDSFAQTEEVWNTERTDIFCGARIDAMVLDGDILYMTNIEYMYSIDISDPEHPVFLDTVAWWGEDIITDFCTGLTVCNGYLYGFSAFHGIIIVDIQSPTNMHVVKYVPFNLRYYWNISVYPSGNNILAAHMDSLFVLDVSSPEFPVCKAAYPIYSELDAVNGPPMAVYGDTVCLEWRHEKYDTPELNVHTIEVDGLSGVIGHYPYPYPRIFALQKYGALMYVSEDAGLVTYSLQGNQSWTKIDTDNVHSASTYLHTQGHFLYGISERGCRLHVYDISNPLDPIEVAYYDDWYGGEFRRMIAHKGYVYIGTHDHGVFVIKIDPEVLGTPSVSHTTSLSLSPAYPNPFSGNTTITYSLPVQQHISLDVYNILGRKVQTLYSGLRDPGTHTARLDASALLAGTYRLVLRSAEGVKTQMVVLQ